MVDAHGAEPSSRSPRCIALMDVPPGEQYANVRNPPRGLLGWVKRAEEKLLRNAQPAIQLSSLIRGNRVAVDSLMRALLQHSRRAEFAFVVPDHEKERFQQRALANSLTKGKQPV